MMAMMKLVILLLVVFKATALENSHELPSFSSPSPLSDPPTYADVEQEKLSKALCIAGCAITCLGTPTFLKGLCMGVCIAKCVLTPSDSLNEITCTVDCAQSSANSLPQGANMMNDIGLHCYQQCKRD